MSNEYLSSSGFSYKNSIKSLKSSVTKSYTSYLHCIHFSSTFIFFSFSIYYNYASILYPSYGLGPLGIYALFTFTLPSFNFFLFSICSYSFYLATISILTKPHNQISKSNLASLFMLGSSVLDFSTDSLINALKIYYVSVGVRTYGTMFVWVQNLFHSLKSISSISSAKC